MGMRFQAFNSRGCQTYLIRPEGAADAVLVDPVLDALEDYLALIENERLKLTHVIDTHTHADHLSAGTALKEATGCAYVMHVRGSPRSVTSRIVEGSASPLGDLDVTVLHTPGHTKDSICLVFPDRILTGDTLFLDDGGAGRDDLPGGDPGEHWDSLQRILGLPDHLVVYPGHEYRGRRPTTLAVQGKRNPHLSRREKAEFIRYLETLRLGPADWMKAVLKANHEGTRDPKAVWIPQEGCACEVAADTAAFPAPSITAEELRARLERPAGLILLDVREPEELEGELGHLNGITHIPLGSLEERVGELAPFKDREVITICKVGMRAAVAAQILLGAGHANVRVLTGGMARWRDCYK
ncbi:MAG: MBL fold metallo-hydrolase [Planctomycetes bacterium]|nr:MBL fold metallo-hydrolase [Planctomycetota bacterium]